MYMFWQISWRGGLTWGRKGGRELAFEIFDPADRFEAIGKVFPFASGVHLAEGVAQAEQAKGLNREPEFRWWLASRATP